MKVFITAIALFFLFCFQEAKAERLVLKGQGIVLDGDTVELNKERLRLYGIDAPEIGQNCANNYSGRNSKQALLNLIANKMLICELSEKDKYNRFLATCRVGGQDISAVMVQTGSAFAYHKYSTKYASLEVRAKKQNLGVWKHKCLPPGKWKFLNSQKYE